MQTKLLEIEYFFIFFFFTFLPQNNQQQRYSKKGNKEEEEKKRRTKNPYHKIQIVLISTKVRNERLCACICVHVYVNVYVKPEVGSNWLVKRQNMQTEISTRE